MDRNMKQPKDKKILLLGFTLSLLVLVSSLCGLLLKSTYILETENWRIQSIGQDLADLFLVFPVLLISGIQAYRQIKPWTLIFGGTVLFIAYTYAIYCFDLHFNQLFLVYCMSFGLSVYSFLYFLWIERFHGVKPDIAETLPVKGIAFFLIGSSISFSLLWLSDIIPALLHNGVPASLPATGLMTNPVHVLDLSLLLPALFIDAILLLKKRPSALRLTPALLVFCTLMYLNIAGLVIFMHFRNMGGNLTISLIMTGLAAISAYLLTVYLWRIGL